VLKYKDAHPEARGDVSTDWNVGLRVSPSGDLGSLIVGGILISLGKCRLGRTAEMFPLPTFATYQSCQSIQIQFRGAFHDKVGHGQILALAKLIRDSDGG
jgi:hypothetical protein